ncbi:MAG TPA: hypothetical protein VGF69_23470 [Thermoanaerobaculia bacterium]|jgi:hypothetical protein
MSSKTMNLIAEVSFNDIARGIATLDLRRVATAAEETENDRIARLLTIYLAIRPLLSALTSLRLIPPPWRKAIGAFMESLDSLAILRGFKAGKDL